MQTEAPPPAPGDAHHSALGDAGAFDQDVPDLSTKKSGGQGKKLIVVGIVAAGLAFAGVYLMQTSRGRPRWRLRRVPRRPSPLPPLQYPRWASPASQPLHRHRPPVEAVPVKPAEKLPTPEPTAGPSKTKPEVVEKAKPVEVAKPV